MDGLYTDISSNSGDMDRNDTGDMTTASGVGNLTGALKRRFETPLGALFYDQTYGNPLFNRLSAPMGQSFEANAISDITACILSDKRVQSVKVQATVDRESRMITFSINFIANNGESGSFERGVSMRV
ncbi:hypothetical protein [Paenibacillus alba]|uniref:IraD/Gp25-like domain-containing protein n=1 Tax=Paenibacillus alba TaxID=1197127 RepID=A0ABU6GAW5_9BACL|nr:hypothetical protein [Paenibacillus alba]MEC0231281.1 hypothetical protein [Paenibacillus alba]